MAAISAKQYNPDIKAQYESLIKKGKSKKSALGAATSNDLTAVGITTCLPSELTSSLRIGEFPCRLLPTKNHHFAALRFPDFQR
jgi:hypothetical protein